VIKRNFLRDFDVINIFKDKWFILTIVVCVTTYHICSQWVAASIGNKNISKGMTAQQCWIQKGFHSRRLHHFFNRTLPLLERVCYAPAQGPPREPISQSKSTSLSVLGNHTNENACPPYLHFAKHANGALTCQYLCYDASEAHGKNRSNTIYFMKSKLSKLSILVVNYKYDTREDNDLVELTRDGELSKVFKDVPGLGMKFGLANPEDNEYGGIYLFEDDASLEAFLASPILKEWASNPDVSQLTHKRYNALPDFTKNTIKDNYVTGDIINDLDSVSERDNRP
jgi:hypothetical protein